MSGAIAMLDFIEEELLQINLENETCRHLVMNGWFSAEEDAVDGTEEI